MVKIVSEYNGRGVMQSVVLGQAFPDVKGKLMSVEVNGRELARLLQKRAADDRPIPLPQHQQETSFLTWHGRHAGRVLRELRELFEGG